MDINNFVLIPEKDLRNLFQDALAKNNEELRNAIAKDLQDAKTPQHFTRNKTSEILNLSLPTLWKLDKTGVLKAVRIGTKVLYLASDVESYLESLKVPK